MMLTKEHWTQAGLGVLTSLVVVGGAMITATLWIVGSINGVGQADRDAMSLMDRRVTTLEVQQKGESQSIDRLSISIDQERAATTDLASAVTKLQQVIDDTRRR